MKDDGGGGGAGFVRADQIDLKTLDEQLERHLARAWTMEKPPPRKDQDAQPNKPREPWEADPARLVIRGVIARGTFGTVHRGVYDGIDVAGTYSTPILSLLPSPSGLRSSTVHCPVHCHQACQSPLVTVTDEPVVSLLARCPPVGCSTECPRP
jgi:hypothetical protein